MVLTCDVAQRSTALRFQRFQRFQRFRPKQTTARYRLCSTHPGVPVQSDRANLSTPPIVCLFCSQ